MYDAIVCMHDAILSWQIMSASHHNVTWTPTSSDLSKTYPLNRTLQWACVKAGLPDHLDQQKCRPNKEWALLVFSGGTGTKVCQAGFWTNTFMGTPTTRSLRAKTGSFSNNYRGWNKFQTVFSLLHKTTSNTATFRSEPDLLQATLHKSLQQWQVHYYSALLLK